MRPRCSGDYRKEQKEMKCYTYLRTSADDRDKAGIPVQREGCAVFAARTGMESVREFADDGISGTIPMDERPSGKEMVAAIAANGVEAVLVWNGERIGREQPIFWQFIGLCRAKRMEVFDHEGHKLTDPMEGAIYGMTAEMDYRKIIERLAAGKRQWRGTKRVDGRWPFGEHPSHEYDREREIVARIQKMAASGVSSYKIAKLLNAERVLTRYDCQWRVQTVKNIIRREVRQ
jgi:DNA invertase Pin-like site-specific DNA recombinase